VATAVTECGCWTCTKERADKLPHADPDTGDVFWGMSKLGLMMRMFTCETCGNKRCPHATDHRLACTNSNEPGQKGSRYE
jgi:hypothetical protein